MPKTVKFATAIRKETHKALRDYCERTGKKIRFVVEAAVLDYIEKENGRKAR